MSGLSKWNPLEGKAAADGPSRDRIYHAAADTLPPKHAPATMLDPTQPQADEPEVELALDAVGRAFLDVAALRRVEGSRTWSTEANDIIQHDITLALKYWISDHKYR